MDRPTSEQGSRQLPSGRHGLPRKYVRDNQRQRILDGVMRAVALTGYANTTVGDIITAARLSRRTFYEHFEGKDDCFLAAYETAVDNALRTTRRAAASTDSFPEQVSLVLDAFITTVTSNPDMARGCLVEVTAGGDIALHRRDEALRTFAAVLREHGQTELPDGVVVPALAAELVVSGLCEAVIARLVQNRVADLRDELPQMVYCALAPYCGHQRATAFAAGTPA